MRIIGIDPGLVNTGYGVIEDQDGRQVALEGGVIRTKPEQPLEKRLLSIYTDIRDVLIQYKPDAMAVEDLHSRYRNLKTAIIMGHARGVAVLAAGEVGVPVFDYQPTRAKNIVTGSGAAGKEQIQRAVAAHLGIPEVSRSEHVADAFAIAICHAIVSGSPAHKAVLAAKG